MNPMKPILFNTEMVRAIMDGRKTVTRRLIKPQPSGKVSHYTGYKTDFWGEEKQTSTGNYLSQMKMPCQPGNVLYVREAWRVRNIFGEYSRGDRTAEIEFRAAGPRVLIRGITADFEEKWRPGTGWHPSIHMPKEAARLFLKVKLVEAQRLQDFLSCRSEIAKEGIAFDDFDTTTKHFKELWDSTLHSDNILEFGFDANPWVWAIEFECCKKPE